MSRGVAGDGRKIVGSYCEDVGGECAGRSDNAADRHRWVDREGIENVGPCDLIRWQRSRWGVRAEGWRIPGQCGGSHLGFSNAG